MSNQSDNRFYRTNDPSFQELNAIERSKGRAVNTQEQEDREDQEPQPEPVPCLPASVNGIRYDQDAQPAPICWLNYQQKKALEKHGGWPGIMPFPESYKK